MTANMLSPAGGERDGTTVTRAPRSSNHPTRYSTRASLDSPATVGNETSRSSSLTATDSGRRRDRPARVHPLEDRANCVDRLVRLGAAHDQRRREHEAVGALAHDHSSLTPN